MFESDVLHTEDILERLEEELKITYAERQNLPPHKRVPMSEWNQWGDSISSKIASLSDAAATKRYEALHEEMQNFDGSIPENYLKKAIEYAHGVLRLIRQLDRLYATNTQYSLAPKSGVTPMTGSSIHYDVFISHASEDKEEIARPLSDALSAAGLGVWLDTAVLELGDSLRRKIDEGLCMCRYGVVVLSPSFLSKEWPQRELDGLFARETSTGEKAILPVLHRLTRAQLARYSPLLADRLNVLSSEGISVVASQIVAVVLRKRSGT